MMDGWTLEELVRRVAEAIAADDVRAPNGRVREVPDARAIRWYTTIGLVDRPAGFRGRTALYGPRHLLQAVAVKRRQALGHALAQIQQELTGATDATLGRLARVPARLLTPGATPPGDAPAPPPLVGTHPPAPTSAPFPQPAPLPPVRRRDRFWTASPAAPAAAPPTPHVTPAPGPAVTSSPSPAPVPSPIPVPPPVPAEVRYRVVLPAGVALDLPVAPSPRDLADIRTAAEPLLRLLARRGLLTFEESSDDDH
jgi:hypothetical protein